MRFERFDLQKYDDEIIKSAMDRVEAGAEIVRDAAKRILFSKVQGRWKEHGPYKKRPDYWTERTHGAMVKTIRTFRDDKKKKVKILAGDKKTWWAKQLEYGNGEWKGGAKPFLRPALMQSEGQVEYVLESGAGQTRE